MKGLWSANDLCRVALAATALLLFSSPQSLGKDASSTQPGRKDLELRMAGAPLSGASRIVVLFHGYGAPGDDLVALANSLEAGEGAAFVLPAAPHGTANGGLCWQRRDGSGFTASRAAALRVVHELRRANPSANLVLGGFSQGGMMATSLLAEGLENIEAAILMSPSRESEPLPLPRELPAVLITHGTKDEIIPIRESVALRDRLRAAGARVSWFRFDGGHTIPRDALAAMNSFLASLEPSVQMEAPAGP